MAAGAVKTGPALGVIGRAGAYLGSNQGSVTTATWIDVQFDTEEFSAGDMVLQTSGNTGAVKVNTAGNYLFSAALRLDTLSAATRVGVRFRNETAAENFGQVDLLPARSGDNQFHSSCPQFVSAGDEIHAQVFHNEGSDATLESGEDNTWFRIARLHS